MTVVVAIVEGDGEVSALPILLRRLREHFGSEPSIEVATPIRVQRDRFLNREEEFRRMLLLAAAKCGDGGWILVLLDADDDCPVSLSGDIRRRAQSFVPHRAVSVVLANREYESWVVASAVTLDGRRGLKLLVNEELPSMPDAIRGAKEWLSRRMPGTRYRETSDQAGFTALLDIELVYATSRSFRKLCDDWRRFSGMRIGTE